MKSQILQLLLLAGVGSFFATGCCCPKQVAVVKKPPVLAPTGPVVTEKHEVLLPRPVIAEKTEVLPPTGPILVKEYMIPPKPAEVVVVTSTRPVERVDTGWYFTGIRWVWLP
jgi:hypothetical protein